jgi:hypothetical protein
MVLKKNVNKNLLNLLNHNNYCSRLWINSKNITKIIKTNTNLDLLHEIV